jgi:protein-L-isoaspartate(D-aspartate) O-methyltransferase
MINQLAPDGILLIPVGGAQLYQELVRIRKRRDGRFSQEKLGGVAFVPMRGKRGWKV